MTLGNCPVYYQNWGPTDPNPPYVAKPWFGYIGGGQLHTDQYTIYNTYNMSAFLYSANIRDAWSALCYGDTWYWDEVPVYYQNWGPINPNPSDSDRWWYGLLTTEGGGHWTHVTWHRWRDIQPGIYQRQKGEQIYPY